MYIMRKRVIGLVQQTLGMALLLQAAQVGGELRMLLAQGPPHVLSRPDVFESGEMVQHVATHVTSGVMAIVSQLHVHFWFNRKEMTYLTAVPAPRCSLDDDPAIRALWNSHNATQLVVATCRRILFYKVDIQMHGTGLFEIAPRSRTHVGFCDALLRVSFKGEVPVEGGRVVSLQPAGSQAFLVCTTAGVVYIVSWAAQRVLHAWSALDFRSSAHDIILAEREVPPPGMAASQCVSMLSEPTKNFSNEHATGAAALLSVGVVRPPSVAVGCRGRALAGVAARGATDHCVEDTEASGVDACHSVALTQPLFSSTILHATFAVAASLFSFVLSSGHVLLAEPSCGAHFAATDVRLHGCLFPIASAATTCINASHSLIAMSTLTGGVVCYGITSVRFALSSAPLWRCTSQQFAAQQHGKKLGPVSEMQWSPGSEDMLCVGFYQAGIVVLHHSGLCVMRSLFTEGASVPHYDLQPFNVTAGRPAAAALRGCLSLHWTRCSSRLFVVEPQSKEFLCYEFVRVLRDAGVGPCPGTCTPMLLLGADAVGLVHYTDSDGSPGVKQRVQAPQRYLETNYPLHYGAMSVDNGGWLVCAGCRGCVTYHCASRCWFLFKDVEEERAMVCVADPVWLMNGLLALPMRRVDGAGWYAVGLYNPRVLAHQSALATIPMEHRPLLLGAAKHCNRGESFLCVLDSRQSLHVYYIDIVVEAAPPHALAPATPELLHKVLLSGSWSRPLSMQPVYLGEGSLGTSGSWSYGCKGRGLAILLHLRESHDLVFMSLTAAAALPFPLCHDAEGVDKLLSCMLWRSFMEGRQPQRRVFDFWVDHFTPLGGFSFATFEEEGLFYNHVPAASSGVSSLARLSLAPRDEEALPLVLSPFDGYILCLAHPYAATCALHVAVLHHPHFAASASAFVLRPVLYAHRVLALLLQEFMAASTEGASAGAGTARRGGSSDHQGSALAGQGKEAGGGAVSQQQQQVTLEQSLLENATRPSARFVWNDSLFLWLEAMRENGSFVPNMDYFLHSIFNDCPPAAVAGLNRGGALEATVSLLRLYPEFYEIVMACIRKLDVACCSDLFDIGGSPLNLYQECVANCRYAEAVQLVRVILMDSYCPALPGRSLAASSSHASLGVANTPEVNSSTRLAPRAMAQVEDAAQQRSALHKASACAIELFTHSIQEGCFVVAYDLLRFMALLRHEVGMPAAAEVENQGSGSASLFKRWIDLWGAGSKGPTTAPPQEKDDVVGDCTLLRFMPSFTAKIADVNQGGPVDAMAAEEEEQRRGATKLMFRLYSSLPRVVEAKAVELLEQGYWVRLCRLLETFSLSLQYFLQGQAKRSAEAAKGGKEHRKRCGAGHPPCLAPALGTHEAPAVGLLTSLPRVLKGLHTELGFPLYCRPVGSVVAVNILACGETADAARLCHDRALWTQTQLILYGDRERLALVHALRAVFTGHVDFDLVFSLLLMSKADLLTALSPVSAEDRQGCVSRLHRLAAVTSDPVHSGYKAFVHDVFSSLPPDLFKAEDIVLQRPEERLLESDADPQTQNSLSQIVIQSLTDHLECVKVIPEREAARAP